MLCAHQKDLFQKNNVGAILYEKNHRYHHKLNLVLSSDPYSRRIAASDEKQEETLELKLLWGLSRSVGERVAI